ncbi:hypothetical protein [Reyranella sp.]|uniref:hypothetical protein n=1 Tax=Reyranella sp. TaxID=1929291 RepID=UPI003C7A6D1F
MDPAIGTLIRQMTRSSNARIKILDRLYVLRNQLLHGGATWNSSVNRSQVRDGAAVLSRLTLELELVALRHQLTVLRRQRPGRRHLYERRAACTFCSD